MLKNSNDRQMSVTVETKTVIRVLLIIAVGALFIIFLSKIIHPLILILVSFFLALALNPAVSFLSRRFKNGSRVRATAVAYIMVISLLIGFFSFVLPPLVSQTVDFVKDVPSTIQEVKNQDSAVSRFIYKYKIDKQIDQFTGDFGSRYSSWSKPALSTAGKIGSTLVSVITVIVLTFMMLVEGPAWIEKYFKALKTKHRVHQKELASKMYKVVVGFVNGQVLVAAIGGLFATITLFILSQVLDVPINPLALGGIIFIFALLPLIGTIIGSVIVVLACMLVSFPLAIIMAIYFLVYQQIENVTIQPYIQSKTNSLTPLLVLLAALLGVGLGGLLGAILAIPTAGCIKVLLDDYFENKKQQL